MLNFNVHWKMGYSINVIFAITVSELYNVMNLLWFNLEHLNDLKYIPLHSSINGTFIVQSQYTTVWQESCYGTKI